MLRGVMILMLSRAVSLAPRSGLSTIVMSAVEAGQRPRPIIRKTGALRKLPEIPKKDELYRRASNAAKRIEFDHTVKNNKLRARKRAAQQADVMAQTISVPLRACLKAHAPDSLRRSLHPFELAQANLTQSARQSRPLDKVLDDIRALRREILEDGKAGAALAKAAENAAAAAEASEKTHEVIRARLGRYEHAINELRLIQRAFRRLPTVSLSSPTVVFVGAPNVGKSTMVTELSTGVPEIGNYPFTTRAITLGHVFEEGKELGQIMDTPGLLDRPDAERNEMEELTLATMTCLPSAVVFVVDLSGHAGDAHSSPDKQLKVRNALRAKFPKRPWIDVISKTDLGVLDPALEPPADAIRISMRARIGLDELQAEVKNLLRIVERATRSHYAPEDNNRSVLYQPQPAQEHDRIQEARVNEERRKLGAKE